MGMACKKALKLEEAAEGQETAGRQPGWNWERAESGWMRLKVGGIQISYGSGHGRLRGP